MIKHVVMWKVKNNLTNKEEVKINIKNNLERLVDIIPELLGAEVKIDMEEGSTHDIALFSKVRNKQDLQKYANHPAHIKVAEKFIKPYTEARVCVDFTI